MTFRWRGSDHEYFDHPYNSTITNERAIEIPIALDFLAGVRRDRPLGSGPLDGLEVGNVLDHYVPYTSAPRRIVDRYEVDGDANHTIDNLDVFEIAGSYDWIVCISTLEHIRWHPGTNQHNEWASAAAMIYLRGLLRPGGRALFTVGLGQHPTFDRFLYETGQGGYVLRTRSDDPADNDWQPCGRLQTWEYGPTHGANALWVGVVEV